MALPLIAAALSGPVIVSILRAFGLWFLRVMVAKILFSLVGLIVSVAVVEFIPRLLGLGQGLISWAWQSGAVGIYNAFVGALSLVGVDLPDFNELLGTLPSEIIWLGSVMRIHKVVFILVSIPIFNLFLSVMHKVSSIAAGASLAARLMTLGRGI